MKLAYFAKINYFMFLSGREVVFQCRDEGPLRVDVKWSRGNGAEGLPFPRGTRDFDGRLEIPNIQVNIKNRGTKIYSAVMFSLYLMKGYIGYLLSFIGKAYWDVYLSSCWISKNLSWSHKIWLP